jgi:uncharacterized protein (TIGR02147 family)
VCRFEALIGVGKMFGNDVMAAISDINLAPNVFDYDDYRKFIADWFTFQNGTAADKKSVRQVTNLAGFKSPNYINLIIHGKRNLTTESIEGLAKSMELDASEFHFFRQLILFNQAKTHQAKISHLDELLKSRRYKNVHPVRAAQMEYYAKWYYVVIREMVTLEDFNPDPKWIAKRVIPNIKPKEAEDAIDKLLQLGLIERDATGKFNVTNRLITPSDKLGSASLKEFHKNVIHKASEALDLFVQKDREISCLTFAVNKATAEEMKALIVEFKRRLFTMIQENKCADEVYQVNFQFFPLTQKSDDQESGDKK